MATFMDRFLDSRYRKRQKIERSLVSLAQMAFLAPPKAPHRKLSERLYRPPNELDDYLSSDLEVSFASTVSLNSPPRELVDLSADSSFPDAMDISPAPRGKFATIDKGYARPRASTTSARLFGNDISNSKEAPTPPTASIKTDGTQATLKTQRIALPTEWMNYTQPADVSQDNIFAPTNDTHALSLDDAMDIDTSFIVYDDHDEHDNPDVYLSSPPTAPAGGFNTLFFESNSPRRSMDSPSSSQTKKRRSLSPEPTRLTLHHNTSSPMLSSPSREDFASPTVVARATKPSLQGLGAPSGNLLKRTRRPVVSAQVPPSDMRETYSAYPSTDAGQSMDHQQLLRIKGPQPVRRAFSALATNLQEPYSEESSFDGPDMSSPAQAYTKRQQGRTLRRCDGTEDLRPLAAASPGISLGLRDSPSSRYFSPGLGGFGDNEAHGKILPCHRVREDGLMRIKPETVNQLLDGVYDDKIVNYHIIDCRFDYEYNGGHISGAININTTPAVEELLLGSGVHKPKPSTSADSAKKTILVFHCEFSAKRGPTFAKHLRAKDRAMNNHVYPKIHYPEVYILEGGYCGYFRASRGRCEPQSYVKMDDPTHALSRREDLDQFRKAKFGRTKSYVFGETTKNSLQQQQHSRRSSQPNAAPSSLFAAAATRGRRSAGGTLSALPEDANTSVEETDVDIGDSPCPPPTKHAALKSKKVGRAPLSRAETYHTSRVPY